MPILSNFPSGSGSGGGGLALAAVTNINTLTSHEKVYVKWTDPQDLVVANPLWLNGAELCLYARLALCPSAAETALSSWTAR